MLCLLNVDCSRTVWIYLQFLRASCLSSELTLLAQPYAISTMKNNHFVLSEKAKKVNNLEEIVIFSSFNDLQTF